VLLFSFFLRIRLPVVERRSLQQLSSVVVLELLTNIIGAMRSGHGLQEVQPAPGVTVGMFELSFGLAHCTAYMLYDHSFNGLLFLHLEIREGIDDPRPHGVLAVWLSN
jgi:hypothetical protein